MAKKQSIDSTKRSSTLRLKVGSNVHVTLKEGQKDLNLLMEVSESHKKHYKIVWCKIPSTRGKKPKIIKQFYWTTMAQFKAYVQKIKGVLVTKTQANKHLKNGL